MRFALLLLLLTACPGTPCLFVCGTDSECPAFSTCRDHAACLSTCSNIVCNGACVDSFHNCGGCGVACAAGQVCGHAGCETACENGLTNCSGSCMDLKNDRLNCGACAHFCNANEYCSGGVCRAVCE